MRSLARAVAILCLIASVSCSDDAPTRPEPAALVEGTVEISILDRDGNPLALDVYFDRAGNDGEPIKFVAGPDARHVDLPVGSYFVGLDPHSASGYPIAQIPEFRVSAGSNRLEYRYTGTRISGSTSFEGAPLSDVSVTLLASDKIVAWQVARDGRYSFVMPPGTYEVRAMPSLLHEKGLPELVILSGTLTLPEEDITRDFDFTGHETQVLVTVKGQPVFDASVVAQRTGARAAGMTNGAGLSTHFLPGGDYTFEVTRVPGVTVPLTVTRPITSPGTVPMDFTGVTWNVTLLRKDDLSLVRGAWARVAEVGSSRQGGARADDLGRFQILVAPDVPHEVLVTLPGQTSPGPYPVVGTVSTSTDATFDLLVDLPPFP